MQHPIPSAYHYQYSDKGEKIKMKRWDWWTGKFENQDKEKKLYVAFGKLVSTDLVAEGAVTDSLFHKILTMSETTKPAAEETAEVTALKKQVSDLQAELTALKAGQTPAAADAAPAAAEAPATAELSALSAQIVELQRQIKELSKQPADVHTSGKSQEDPPAKETTYSAVTAKAMARFDRSKKAAE